MRSRLVAAAVAAAVLASPVQALAEPAPVTGVELNHPLSAAVAVNATFDFADGRRGFEEMRTLRGEMWDRNPMFKGVRLQDYAKSRGLATKQEYVDAVTYDDGLSRIAVQRSIEAAKKFEHSRTANDACELGSAFACTPESTATIDGKGGWGNNLAVGYSSITASVREGWGYGELSALKAANGFFNKGNGHLYQLLNPDNRYMGFGFVKLPGSDYRTAAATTFAEGPTGAAPLPTGKRTEIFYRAAEGNEKPTGAVDNPTQAANADDDLDTAGSSSPQMIGAIVGIVSSILGIIAMIARFFNMI